MPAAERDLGMFWVSTVYRRTDICRRIDENIVNMPRERHKRCGLAFKWISAKPS
jgi:hypothetical protein